MTGASDQQTSQLVRRHRLVAGVLVAVFAAMVGAAYAAVPIYKLICVASGLNGTTQRVAGNGVTILDRKITVHFDTNTGADMPWEFKPLQASLTVRIGETSMAYFGAYNPTGRTISGNATFNVTPEIAGRRSCWSVKIWMKSLSCPIESSSCSTVNWCMRSPPRWPTLKSSADIWPDTVKITPGTLLQPPWRRWRHDDPEFRPTL